MIFDSTQANILSLLSDVGALSKEQLIRYFSAEKPAVKVEGILDKMTEQSFINYDEKYDRYSYPAAPDIKETVTSRRIKAFWVLANIGSTNILQTYILGYPRQLAYINAENYAYDITVVTNPEEAAMAKRAADMERIKDVTDDVYHIAIVDTVELGQTMGQYGFDCYAIVNPLDHTVQYFDLSEE